MRGVRVRRLVAILFAVLLLPAPAAAAAGEESIAALQVIAEVRPDGTVAFSETIDYDFGDSARHGILRTIPRWDDLPDGKRRRYELRIEDVTLDGAAVPVRSSDEGAFRVLTIGDPDTTVSGRHRYVIRYGIANALTTLRAEDLQQAPGVTPGDVELYWDLIGNGWEVPILRAEAVVVGPAAPLLTRCYSGATGSTSTCAISVANDSTRFGPVALAANEALTAVVTYPRSAFTSVAAADIIDQPEPPLTRFLRVLPASGAVALLLLLLLLRSARRRAAALVTVPVREAVVFEPPLRLRPAEMAVAWKGGFDGRILTATLLDLAARGAVTLTPARRRRLRVDRRGSVDLQPWEQNVLDATLRGSDSAEVGKYDPKLAKAVQAAQAELRARAESTGIRNRAAGQPRRRWIATWALGLLLLVPGLALAAAAPEAGAVGLPLAASLVVGGLLAQFRTPLLQTETSADFLSQVQGFRRLLDTDAAAARREFAHRSGLSPAAIFATVLPFAVVYGLDEAWTGAFPDLTPDDLRAQGLAFGTAQALHRDVNVAARAFAAAMAQPSSGGSGSSGGSAGGGGGGGGGGSW